jgi:hypothetical protein
MKWDFFLNKSKKIVPDACRIWYDSLKGDEMFFLFLRKAC